MSCTPTLVQDAWRGRNDDGNETTATWKGTGADNQDWTQAVDVNFRIRLHVQVTNACAAANKVFQLEYSLNSGTWTSVNASSSVVRSSASPNLADAATTTDQMTTGTGTFIGLTAYDEVDGACGGSQLDIAASGQTEVEFCVQIRSADVVNADSIQLRVSSTNLASWTATPTITVQEASTTTLTASPGSMSLTGATEGSRISALADKGTLALTGKDATFSQTLKLLADKGVLSFSGGSATSTTTLPGSPGSLTLTGSDATLKQLLALLAEKSSLTLSGGAAGFTETLLAALGALAFTGATAAFQDIPPGAVTLTADLGILTLTGQDAFYFLTVDAAKNSMTLTGQDAAFIQSLSAVGGTVVLSGDAAVFVTKLLADKGALTLIRSTASFPGLGPTRTYRSMSTAFWRRSWAGS